MELAEKFSDNASLNYQCAWSFDLLGKEAETIPFYEKGIKLGLDEEKLEGALVGLGRHTERLVNTKNLKVHS